MSLHNPQMRPALPKLCRNFGAPSQFSLPIIDSRTSLFCCTQLHSIKLYSIKLKTWKVHLLKRIYPLPTAGHHLPVQFAAIILNELWQCDDEKQGGWKIFQEQLTYLSFLWQFLWQQKWQFHNIFYTLNILKQLFVIFYVVPNPLISEEKIL
jgi:hypothetical protein